jgi:hypothetical protein
MSNLTTHNSIRTIQKHDGKRSHSGGPRAISCWRRSERGSHLFPVCSWSSWTRNAPTTCSYARGAVPIYSTCTVTCGDSLIDGIANVEWIARLSLAVVHFQNQLHPVGRRLAQVIDSSNFKSELAKHPSQQNKHEAYMTIWQTMKQAQPDEAPEPVIGTQEETQFCEPFTSFQR